jgi:anthranilate synthase/indole-3-glycerol phosphate synthase/phosphoribosylanthranilate isomerase
MHGKVSKIRHDNRGCFKDIPQGIESIRYHSLSAAHTTLPSSLSITSITEESGVIMGVRHRKYTLEAVQYHPESILSQGGDDLIRNFLSLRGGTWEENPHSRVLDHSLPPFPVKALTKDIAANAEIANMIPSFLQQIHDQRLSDIALAQSTPGTTTADLEALLRLNIAPSLISFTSRLKNNQTGRPSLLAEIKRASPSEGPISLSTSPATQALKYALAGAHAISVLTEPTWFKGSLQDMHHTRMSVAHLTNRPAILRKDFILSRYQVLESRIWGADAILLIASMLPEPLLKDLYAYSVELGMEPLVEVHDAREMGIALSIPAKVIGVNNRNLHDFNVDLGTTSRLSDLAKGKNIIFCALSGISTPEDVKRYTSDGVDAVLVGESLMRAEDPAMFIRTLLSLPEPSPSIADWQIAPPLVKICGIRSKDEALVAAEAGADMLGLMFVEKSKRFIDFQTAKDISEAIRIKRYSTTPPSSSADIEGKPWFTTHASRLSASTSRPLLVGVFQNHPLAFILHAVLHIQLDVVQLHGTEPEEWVHQIPVPVIRVFHVGNGKGARGITRGGAHQYVLLDSLRDDGSGVSGGSGKTVDWDFAKDVVDAGEIVEKPQSSNAKSGKFPLPIILAGGLTPTNVAEAIVRVCPWAVDVSGGVENQDGTAKDLDKVREFIVAAKQQTRGTISV